jgi:type I restriction enzyme S subunit
MAKPEIRLKGFEGEWIPKTIGAIANVIGGGTPSTVVDNYWNGNIQWFTPSEVGKSRYVSRSERTISKEGLEKSSAQMLPANSILLSSRATVGECSINTRECCTNQGFQSLVPKKVELDFLYSLISTIKKDMIRESSGSTFLEISANKVRDLNVFIPDIDEQKSLGDYFKSLDSLIHATTRKIVSLKQMKSASLISFFPQNGESRPRVRFKGFEGKWVYSQLGDIFLERIESNIHGEMLSVTMNDGIIKASENGRFDNSNSDKSKYKVVKINDIAYNSMRMWQGASGCSQYEGIVSPAYTVVMPVDGIDSKFFSYMFKTLPMIKLFRLHSQGLTSDTWNLKYPAFSKIKVLYPKDIIEQQKIASFFTSLDKQISLQEQRLEKLKQIKSACLDKMFV